MAEPVEGDTAFLGIAVPQAHGICLKVLCLRCSQNLVSHVGRKLSNNLAYCSTTERNRLSSPLPRPSLGVFSLPQCGCLWSLRALRLQDSIYFRRQRGIPGTTCQFRGEGKRKKEREAKEEETMAEGLMPFLGPLRWILGRVPGTPQRRSNCFSE